jgi:Tol biopolymer transport system component
MGRDGRVLGEVAPEQAFSSLRLAPDGDRIAISIRDGGGADHLWIIDSARHTTSRFTFDAGRETRPVWSPDGRQIAFSANRSGTYQLFVKDSRGIGVEIPTSSGGEDKNLTDWSPDGRYLLYSTIEPGNRDDLLAWPLTRDPKPVPIVRTPFEDTAGQFSPDGRWIAYQSTETGRPEVYLQSFPSSGGKWQVSNSGGEAPRWRGDGKELFYLTPAVDLQDLMAVDVQLSPGGPQLSTPHRLFSVSTGGQVYPYDVTRDGQRFVVEQISPQSASPPLAVMLNWQEELKQRVPTR